jgi:hypothetical protein
MFLNYMEVTMRLVLIPLFARAAMGADNPQSAPDGAPANPADRSDTQFSHDGGPVDEGRALAMRETLGTETEEELACRDRITQARVASGQPPLLKRGPATPEDPVLIYAVDRRQDGCAVMVMMGDAEDIRPLPEVERGPLLRRADTPTGN